jgi:hypothetical protein
MYGPDAKSPFYWNWARAVLDYNRDDYYRAHIPSVPISRTAQTSSRFPHFP